MANQDNRADHGQRDAPPRQTNGTSRRRLLYLLGAGGAAGLAGCSGGNDGGGGTATDTASTATGTTTATEMGDTKKELHESVTFGVGLNFVQSSLLPKYQFILGTYRAALEPLVRASRNFKAIPWLAKDWERTGEKTWEYTLRENVTFHNGDSLTADLVVSWWDHTVSAHAWYPKYRGVEPDGVKKVDDMTIEMTTPSPTGNHPTQLAGTVIYHPETSVRKEGNDIADVAGTGPYKHEEIKIDKFARYSAYDNYWGGDPATSGPHTEELIYRPLGDFNTRALALVGQKVDVGQSLPPGQFDSIKNAKNTKVVAHHSGKLAQMHLNLYDKPTSDFKFRKAINYAISQEKIVEGPMNGLGTPARGQTSPAIWLSPYDSLPTYGPDKAKAKQLLEQSSYNGETLQYFGNEDQRAPNLVGSIIQQELKEIGVNLEIQVLGRSVYEDRKKQGDFDIFAGYNGISNPDIISNNYQAFASADIPQGRPEKTKYYANIGHNQPEVQKKYDSFYTKIHKAKSDEKVKELASKLEHVLMEDALPVVPLFHPKEYVGMRSGIEGVDWHPLFKPSRIENLKYFK